MITKQGAETEIYFSKTLILFKVFSRLFWMFIIAVFCYLILKSFKPGNWPVFETVLLAVFFVVCPLILVAEFAGYLKYLFHSNKTPFFKFSNNTIEISIPYEKPEIFYYSEIKYFFLREEKYNQADPDLYIIFYDSHGKKGVLKKHFRNLYYKKYDLGIFAEKNSEIISIFKEYSGKKLFRKVYESKSSD